VSEPGKDFATQREEAWDAYSVLFQTPNSTCTATEYPAIVDVDNDGNAEIVASRNQICGFGPQVGIAVFGDANDTWVPTRRIWNQHAYYITNVNENGAIPASPANNWQVAGLNNFRLNTFTPDEGRVTDAPDLTASFLRCEDGNAVARVGNGGGLLVGVGVEVGVYDGDPAGGGTRLGTVFTSGPLGPNRPSGEAEAPGRNPDVEDCPRSKKPTETYLYGFLVHT